MPPPPPPQRQASASATGTKTKNNFDQVRTTLVYINWGIVLITCVLSFLASFIYGPQQSKNVVGFYEGYFGFNSTTISPSDPASWVAMVDDDGLTKWDKHGFREISMLYLGIAWPATMDLCLDVYVALAGWWIKWNSGGAQGGSLASKDENQHEIVRLSLLERTTFLFGCLCPALFLFLPMDWPLVLYTVGGEFSNLSGFLTFAPIVIFLERYVKSFTPLLTTFLVLTQALGILLWTSTYMFNPNSTIYADLLLGNEIFVGVSYCLFILMCLVALASNGLVSYVKSVIKGRTEEQQQTADDAFEHFNGEVVPALHMGACFAVSVIQLAWTLSPVKLPADTNTAFNICVIFVEAFVLVIEMRIRQSEVTHGLDQLQSKRAFVRFISHEVRTPLSTASMGLELMATAKFLASVATESTKNAPIAPADRDEFNEELGLVQESLHVAEGIFNDLVEYDGLGSESAPLTLVYTATRLPALVRQALGPLTLQARRGGVVLRDLLCEAGADAAVVEVDQRRIAQAVRTVLAGAIGAAPKGSEVTATLRLTSSAAASEALAAATSSSKSSTKSRPQAAAAATTAAATPPVAVRSGNRRASLAAAGNNQNPMFAPAGTAPAPTKLSCFRRAKVFIGLPDTEPVASASGGGGGIAGMVLLEVAHEGHGFEPRDTKAATQHAFAFNPNMLHGGGGTGGGTGSGLGMAIAKTIVEAQGGCMWVQSDGVGKGASFVMALPLSAATAPAPADPPPCHPGTHAASTPAHNTHQHHHRNSSSTSLSSTATVPQWPLAKSVGSPDKPTPGVPADMSAVEASLGEAEAEAEAEDVKASSRVPFAPPLSPTPDTAAPVIAGNHVLVVEDSPVARTMLVRLLKSLGYTTSEAEDGQVAVRMVTESLKGDVMSLLTPRYSAILCDNVMPNMMGPEAVEKIRALGYDGPILGVTGNTLPEQVADFVQHGVDEVIAKPVKANVIKEVLYKRLSDPRFPVAATGGTGGPATATATTAAAAPVAAGNHVLVVEDSPVARTMLVRLLKSLGYTADEAEDGQQAVDKVRAALMDPNARLYDMILCDSVMPVMDGPTAVQIIRELGYKNPILGVTGNTLPEQVADFVQHGVDEVIAKPVKANVIKDAMQKRLSEPCVIYSSKQN